MNLSETRKIKRFFIYISAILFVAISLQFTSPVIPNPPVTGEFAAPDSVTRILKRACYDCHSSETNLAWYDKIAPISWKVSDDVIAARSAFNFSQWNSMTPAEQSVKLWYIVNMVDQGKMPLASYTAIHTSAKISQADIRVLKNYVVAITGQQTLKSSVTNLVSAKVPENLAAALKASPNGITYSAAYKNWKVISSTNRFDNGTTRVIYGNDITVKAIQQNHINPWPEGAEIAKVVWAKQPEDKDGNIKTGKFSNVQFMIKDSKKFKDTEGWGFARFSTEKLLPYGKTAAFGVECINCHRLAAESGFVFDMPAIKKPARAK